MRSTAVRRCAFPKKGTELASNATLEWTNTTGIGWQYVALGKPMQSASFETSGGAFGNEHLNEEDGLTSERACR